MINQDHKHNRPDQQSNDQMWTTHNNNRDKTKTPPQTLHNWYSNYHAEAMECSKDLDMDLVIFNLFYSVPI